MEERARLERDKVVAEMWLAWRPIAAIAKRTGLKPAGVYALVKRLGLDLIPPVRQIPRAPRRRGRQLEGAVRQMLADRLTYAEIAMTLNITVESVSRLRAEFGLGYGNPSWKIEIESGEVKRLEAERLIAAGSTVNKAAETVGWSPGHLRHVRREFRDGGLGRGERASNMGLSGRTRMMRRILRPFLADPFLEVALGGVARRLKYPLAAVGRACETLKERGILLSDTSVDRDPVWGLRYSRNLRYSLANPLDVAGLRRLLLPEPILNAAGADGRDGDSALLDLHAAIAVKLREEPDKVMARVRYNLAQWGRTDPEGNEPWIRAWTQILEHSPSEVALLLVDGGEAMRDLRRVSAFAGVFSDMAGRRVLLEAELRRLFYRGLSDREISVILGPNAESIRNRRGRMGLRR